MERFIKPKMLERGDTIGIIAPAYAMSPEAFGGALEKIENFGFRVKKAKNLYSTEYTFAGSVEQRAEDFNAMIADDEVNMVYFGGGEVSNEILPYIDYDAVRKHPKIICAFSDSTTLINAIHYKSEIITFYGSAPRTFNNFTDYNRQSFERRLMSNDTHYEKNSEWRVICGGGRVEGLLTGGYLVNFAAMQNGKYFGIDKSEKYILLIEEFEKFCSPAMVSKWFSHIEQSGLFENVSALVFGFYSPHETPLIDEILRRIGGRYNIPVMRMEDFGHGANSTIFPIGTRAVIDVDNDCHFEFCESGVK